jgi:hypothetical protein
VIIDNGQNPSYDDLEARLKNLKGM